MKPKAKIKSPLQSGAKASAGEGMLTIAALFKKQTDRADKIQLSSSGESILSTEDEDCVFIETTAISPYFGKSGFSGACAKVSSASESKGSEKASCIRRKGKLSLIKKTRSDPKECIPPDNSSHNETPAGWNRKEDSLNKNRLSISGKCKESNEQNRPNENRAMVRAVKRQHKQEEEETSATAKKKSAMCTNDDDDDDDCVVVEVNDDASMSQTSDVSQEDMTNSKAVNLAESNDVAVSEEKTGSPFPSTSDHDIFKASEDNTDSNSDKTKSDQSSSQDKKLAHEEPRLSPKSKEQTEGNDADESSVDGSGETVYRVPYYLNNFEAILHSVMEDETNSQLFNAEDMQTISAYRQLSDEAKKLYIRMFSRKLNWIPLNKLNYPEIADDLKPYLQELAEALFIDCDENLTDLQEVLNALSAGDIKALAKSYHLTSTISQKGQVVQELLKKSQQSTISSMFGSKDNGVAKTMLIRAKKYLNGIYKLRAEPRKVFVRVMMLFSLVNTSFDEESGTGGQGQLFQMLMVNMGKVVYPTYTVEKVHNVFKDREDVIRFEHALQLESDLLQCTEKGNWEKAYSVFQTIEEEWKCLEANESIDSWNKSLPVFLRSYTASSVICRLLSAGIEILQRRKDFTGAVNLLRRLLAQTTYSCSHRGYWWERLALNLDAHLKDPLQSLEAVAAGLADKHVRVGHRLALYLRAENICQRPKLKLKHKLKEFHHETVKETPKVHIEGRVLHEGVSPNGTRFLTEESYVDDNAQDMTVCRVEQYVLDYYRKNGFPSGIHAEGSVVSSLFCLFFWDILFMAVPDAFHSPFQAQPLDLHSNMFYTSRKDVIEDRLAKLEKSSVEELQAQAEETWTSKFGVLCAGLNWERMGSIDWVKELLSCMGGKILSGIVGRYARCPRHTRSGFPDLTLWNVETGAFKICEVKGPGDRLSHKQILWIDYLVKLGVDAEVCHVKAVAAKKLKPSTSQ